MAVHLVTGYQGKVHITAADQGKFNAGCFGSGEYVLAVGSMFSASNFAGSIRISSGTLVMQGRHIDMPDGYIDMSIATGSAGMLRNDFIVMRYTKNATTGVESAELAVIKGTAVTADPTDPSYTKGNILSGARTNEMPLYRIRLNGTTIEAIEPLFTVVAPLVNSSGSFYKQNMLINGDFQCNQRGQKTYDIGGSGTYTVDMWRAYSVKVQVLNEGVTLTGKSAEEQGYFTQFIQLGKLKTTNYTISAMVDGQICTFTVTPGASAKEKNFGKFKIACLTTSVWDNDLNDYNNKLKVNILPVGTSSFTITYVDVFEGNIAYPHVKEDYATAIARCKRYIQKSCYVSPIVHSVKVGSNYQYQFGICFDRMAHTYATKPIVESCSWSYYTGENGTSSASGNVTSETITSLEGMFLLRTSSTDAISDVCHGIKGVYVVTCEPRDS